MTRPALLFYVQHLLGIGHLVRASRLARALAAKTFDVTVVVGGDLPDGLDFGTATIVRLPPVKAGPGGFADLVSPDGSVFGPEARAARRDLLLACFARVAPAVLLIEAFPFGRRQMRFELLPLLEAALARPEPPLVATSVRDILQENRRPERDAETVMLLGRFFDRVIVHGDLRLARLDASFPRTAAIADKLVYSGLIGPEQGTPHPEPAAMRLGRRTGGACFETPPAAAPQHEGSRNSVDTASRLRERFDVIVSVGGGAVGAALVRLALAARPLSRLADSAWLVLTGPNLPADAVAEGGSGVTLRRFEPDLPARLRTARLSISQAGYNTVADLLAAPDCRAVLVPHAGGGETEQTRRAGLMRARGWAVAVAEATLDAVGLAAAIDAALDLPPRTAALDLDGAIRTGEILAHDLARRRL